MASVVTLEGNTIEFSPAEVGLIHQVSYKVCRMDIGNIGSIYVYGDIKDIVNKFSLTNNMLVRYK